MNGVTHFLTKFVPQFTRVLWEGRAKMPSILAVMNSVYWNAEGRARRTVKRFVEGFDQAPVNLLASEAIIPHYAGFRKAIEDASGSRRMMALDFPDAQRLRRGLTVLREEAEAL